MNKYSLIMPAYNAEKYIHEAIQSVLLQTYENWELIIVDDGSSDKTASIIDEFAEENNKIKIIHQKNGGTAASARNVALNFVTGDYVQIIDADDTLKENLLGSYEEKLKQQECEILVPNCLYFGQDNRNNIIWEKRAPQNNYEQILDGETAFNLSLKWIIHGLFLVKKELIFQIKYDPKLVNGDEFTTRKLLFNAKKIGFVDSYYYYRSNLDSTTKSSRNKYRMYESLLTNINIYNYAIDNKMNLQTIDNCIDLLVSSFCGHSVMFYKNMQQTDSIKDKEYAKGILYETFNTITKDMWKKTSFKYRIFYELSRGNSDLFFNEMKFISKLRGN